ncbi:par-3 family cell polarity regulator beta a isoform X3 [Siniperca chuatsi]|uniref:par-3 family cell polarity regulator beta a isoform X3 n=1 Tax=Siniperca chuatsi TaxID=119488 RepID=UPI001CE03C4B|nr:par-3 family cell polarity regulator beta a isoform X3 [Siniperca chuatsi]
MKVTVTFGDTAVVVPCKAGWTVRDLMDQATRRYRRILEQVNTPKTVTYFIPSHEGSVLKTHHLEYIEGGILDMDDMLSDLVEDRDKLVAVLDEVQRRRTDSPRESMSNGYSAPSPEPHHYYPHQQYQEPIRGEIEVNEAILRGNTHLLVRSNSDSVLPPPHEMTATPPPDDHSNRSPEPEVNHTPKGALDQLHTDDPSAKMSQVNFSTLTRTVEFPGNWGPLGIHVVPYCSSLSGRTLGLHIKGIEENSHAKRENIFQEDESIVQINGTPLQDKTFAQSQEVFRQAMSSSSVRLEVLPASHKPRYEKSLIGQLFSADGKDSSAKAKSPKVVRAKTDSQPEPKQDIKLNTKLEVRRPDVRAKTPEPAAVNPPPVELQTGHGSLQRGSPTPAGRAASSSPTPRTNSQSPLVSKSPVLPGLANLTSRKGGKRLKIDLKKGTEGLGFTVVTRDSSVHGPGPILVKNILSRGAAVKDGRLQPGDRILEVNGVDMTGRSQEELVAMLRSTKQGESVCVVVARQEDIFLPRELKGEEVGSLVMEDGREQLMYEIPLNESGSAGLGVSLKGNKSRETGEDLGIFIKSIIHGGAAYKDGRLSVNDQLIAVNGESLLGRSNHAAMDTLRRSMSSEGNARGTIQLVVLRPPRQVQQMGSANPAPSKATNGSATHQPNAQTGSSNQEPWGHNAYQGPSGPSRHPNTEPTMNGASHTPMTTNNFAYSNSGSAPHPAATANGSYGHYGNNDEELEESFPPPPSPGAVEEMNRDLPLTPLRHNEFQKLPHMAAAFYADSQLANDKDNIPRNRASKSMDLVADESNMGSLVGQRNEPSAGGLLGPTLGLWKSSSLESLQTAVSEAKQSLIQAQVPFHRPRPHMVRGRGGNQSFRIAIDKSYDGPSEDDDDLSEQSSGHETPVSSSSRHGLDAEDGKKKKKKTKGKKKEKKSKGKKKTDDSVEDLDKKTKKKGFGLLRFGKKKDDKSKDAAKASKGKLEALSEEELDRIPDNRDGYNPRYTEIHSGHVTPDPASLPDVEDDDSDPNYARINNFRQPPSPQSFISRTPSPAALTGGANLPQTSFEELDGLYAKVNKSRPPPALQNKHQTQADSDPRLQGLRREYQQGRAAPGYEVLDTARRRVLEHDPNRMAPRGAEFRPVHRHEEVDPQYHTHPRRDPYDYPTHSKSMPRESAPYPGHYHDPPVSSHPSRVPLPQTGTQSHEAPSNPRYYPSSPRTGQQHRAAVRQDVPPSPTAGRRGRHYYEAVGGRGDGYRQASPSKYTSPERYDYGDEKQPDPRRKNPMIGAV